ncbi:MAG: DUF885 domain-containing protein, partial [Kordiimonadaceae bacterium]|nr:DUF885 domain-containing protein [Kordiimonadaceae bacterium]
MFFRCRLLFTIFAFGLIATPSGMATDAGHTLLSDLITKERALFYAENPGSGPFDLPQPVAEKMQSVTEADQQRRRKAWQTLHDELDAIKTEGLSAEDTLNHQLMRYHLDAKLLFAKHKTWRLPLQSDSGFHTAPARIWHSINFNTQEDYAAYIAMLQDLPRFLAENTENLRKGLESGFSMPKVVLEGLLPSFDAMVIEDAFDSPFYGPFKGRLVNVSGANSLGLKGAAMAVIEGPVKAAYQQLATFMKETYYPQATSDLAASKRPGGKAYYADMVKYYTTLDVTANDVHDLGLSEVARIRAEMEEVIVQAGFKGSFAEFLAFLRTDPQFYAKTPKELLMHASYFAKIIDGKLPSLFGRLPRQSYGVEAVPDAIAPNYTTGRYLGAAPSGPRGGYYWVNTYALDKRPLYVLPSLTLHEGMPGHHLQIALTLELENVPEFRRALYPHAFGEGWGFYAEKLGIELGLYTTPYEEFGRLSYEMWRACRLVVDTGIHAKGWTRARAIKLLE